LITATKKDLIFVCKLTVIVNVTFGNLVKITLTLISSHSLLLESLVKM